MKSLFLAAAFIAGTGGLALAGALPLKAADGANDGGSDAADQVFDGYFLALDGKPVGPLGLDDIAVLIASGEVTPDTPAWTAGMQGWSAAAGIGMIADLFASATAAPAEGTMADDETPPAPPVAEELPPPPPPPPVQAEIKYFIAVGGQTTGPFTSAEMTAKVAAGELTGSTLVWKKGMAQWAAAETVTEIAALMNDRPKAPPFDCAGYLAGMWEKQTFMSGTNVTIRVLYEAGGQYNGVQQIPGYGGAPLTANFSGTWKASATGEKTCSITAEQHYPYGVSITTIVEVADQFLVADKTNGGEWRRVQ